MTALAEFKTWVLALDEDTLENRFGVPHIEDCMRLIRGFEREQAAVEPRSEYTPMRLMTELKAHEFTSTSKTSPRGIVTRSAGCACGVEFAWEKRDELHTAHLLTVAFRLGQGSPR